MGESNCELVSVTTQPPSDSLPEKRSLLLPENEVDLKTKIYKSDEACAAFLFPFKNYVFDPIIVKSQGAQLTDSMRDLMSQVVSHTPRPVYIKEVATVFIDEVIQRGDFVGIHWRYDMEDWLATNCKVCTRLILIAPEKKWRDKVPPSCNKKHFWEQMML